MTPNERLREAAERLIAAEAAYANHPTIDDKDAELMRVMESAQAVFAVKAGPNRILALLSELTAAEARATELSTSVEALHARLESYGRAVIEAEARATQAEQRAKVDDAFRAMHGYTLQCLREEERKREQAEQALADCRREVDLFHRQRNQWRNDYDASQAALIRAEATAAALRVLLEKARLFVWWAYKGCELPVYEGDDKVGIVSREDVLARIDVLLTPTPKDGAR